MLEITDRLAIPDDDITVIAVRSQGPGGQNVNKVASTVHLRFDVRASSLPQEVKARVLRIRDQRITTDGVVVIKAREYRTFERNREAARRRLAQLIRRVLLPVKRRRPTRPTRASKKRRMDRKTKRGQRKRMRQKIVGDVD